MIDTIIIDDETHCIDHLSGLLTTWCGSMVRLTGTARSVEEGYQVILRLQPKLVFLDIQLHDDTSFALLDRFPVVEFDIIFVTAYERYAIQAFKFSAIDYLLKPVDPDDLRHAVTRLQQKHSKEEAAKRLETLLYNLKNGPGLPKRISVPTVRGLEFLPVQEIVRCESHINYTSIYLTNGQKLTVARTLKEFEELLEEHNFFRVHNSHLINMAFVKSYHKGKGGSVLMMDNTEIEVSTRRKEELLKKLANL
jgi:two-component system LytT family response regulator